MVEARRLGYAKSYGQVEPDAFGVAVPLPHESQAVEACALVITYREDTADRAIPHVVQAAAEIAAAVGGETGA